MKTRWFFTLLMIAALLPGSFPVGEASASNTPEPNVWKNIGPGGGNILTLAIDPKTPTTLYAGTWDSVTDDNGGPNIILNNGPQSISIVDDLVITQTVALQPGVYNLLDVNHDGLIKIEGDNVTLDGSGVVINGVDSSGCGIAMDGHAGLTLRNWDIRGFNYGVCIQNSTRVTIENSNISGNRKDTTSGWLDINTGGDGGGIRFTNVTSSTVQANTLTNQSTGLELINSHYNTARDNVTSSGPAGDESKHNSAWGIRLHSSTHNLVQSNTADYVDRERYGLSSGDSAGILLVVGSHHNQVISNSFTYSGDGFFIGNEYGAPSNYNTMAGNDGSYSPHNAFETTFSDGNIFENNIASHSNYGFWLGYSYNMRVTGNAIDDNSATGIEIDHGRNNQIERNSLQRNQAGIILRQDLPTAFPNFPSANYTIRDNVISFNTTTGIYIKDTAVVSATRNVIESNLNRGVWVLAASSGVTLSQNNLLCTSPVCQYAVYNDMSLGRDVSALDNWWGTLDASAISLMIFDHTDDASKGYVYYTPFLTGPITGEGMLVMPDAVNVIAQAGQPTQSALSLYHYGSTGAVFTVTTSPVNWLSVSPLNGVAPAGGSVSLVVGLNAGSLSTGVYTGLITITHDLPGGPLRVPVTLQVTGGGCGPNLGPWQTTTPLPLPLATSFSVLRGQSLLIYNGYVYVFGGRTTGGTSSWLVYYSAINPDGTLGAWTATTQLPETYYDHAVVRIGNYVYLITGAASATAVYYAHINANGTLGAWTSTSALEPSRQNFAAVAYGNYIYSSGGNAGGTQKFVKFTSVKPDGALNAWADTTPLPKPIEGHTMLVYDGYLYVLAPDQSVYYAAINADGTIGAWVATASLPQAISLYASFENNGFLYTVGGQSVVAQYAGVAGDHTVGPWQRTASLPVQRSGLRMGVNDCVVYAVGGHDGTSYQNTVYYAYLSPAANFVASPVTGSAPLTVVLTGTTSGRTTSRVWNFGDTLTSTLANPAHTYTAPGIYTVSLQVAGPGGSNTIMRMNYITVNVYLYKVFLPVLTK
jgi:parallel beta-helix repeat protein